MLSIAVQASAHSVHSTFHPETARAGAAPHKIWRFLASLIKGFPVILGCSDFVYGDISSIPTELISNPVSKLLLEKSYDCLKSSYLASRTSIFSHFSSPQFWVLSILRPFPIVRFG